MRPVIDTKALDNIRSLSPDSPTEFLHEAITVFLDDLAKQLPNLCDTARSGDASATQRIAHSLKSTSASLGALNLSLLFKRMETMSQTNVLENAGDLLEKIEEEYREVEKALICELRRSAS